MYKANIKYKVDRDCVFALTQRGRSHVYLYEVRRPWLLTRPHGRERVGLASEQLSVGVTEYSLQMLSLEYSYSTIFL